MVVAARGLSRDDRAGLRVEQIDLVVRLFGRLAGVVSLIGVEARGHGLGLADGAGIAAVGDGVLVGCRLGWAVCGCSTGVSMTPGRGTSAAVGFEA